MKSKMNLKLPFASAGLIAALAIAGTAAAATLPKEGRYDTTACWTSTTTSRIDFSKTHWSQVGESVGTGQSNPRGGFGDGSSFRCVAMTTSFDGKMSNNTLCDVVDPDGDKRLNVFTLQDGKIVRETIAGTGKYEGMVITANVESQPMFPTVKPGTTQWCNHQTGTYKLK